MGILKDVIRSGGTSDLGHSIGGTGVDTASAVSSLFGTGGKAINVIEEYNGYAWKVINIRATVLSAEDLFVQRLVGKDWQQDESHPFNEVLEGNSGTRDLSELLEAHSRSMDLFGEAFWYFSKGEKFAKPMATYLLDPRCVTVMIKGDIVTGYVYQKGTVNVTLDVDEVLHRKIEDPKAPFRGYGPMQAAGWFVKNARYTITYVNNFLENNAIPAGVVVAKGTVDDEDWKLFKKQWARNYGGVDNAGKTGFVRSTDLDFVKTGLSIGEVDFEKIKNSSRDDVMFMFGISKPMAAIFDDINRASATVARELFALTFTRPELKSITRKLSKKVAAWYGKQYRVSSTNPVPEDEEAKLAKFDKGVGRWITVNEARAAYGLPAVSGGDVIQPETKGSKTSEPERSKEGADGFLERKTIGKIVIRGKKEQEFFAITEKLQIAAEKSFIKSARAVLDEQLKEQVKQLEPKKFAFAGINIEKEATRLSDAALTALLDLAEDQGKVSMQYTGEDIQFELSSALRDYITTSINKAALSFTKETSEYVAKAIADSLSAGEGLGQTVKRLEAVYSDMNGEGDEIDRLVRLARTETIKASNESAERAYKQSGVVKEKEWMKNPGACPLCRSLNGTTVALGEIFQEGSYEDIAHPPLHPNCRCTLLPVIDE